MEVHSCVDDSTDTRFLSKTQLNDKSTAGRFDLKVFANCVQDEDERLIIQLCLAQEYHISGIV